MADGLKMLGVEHVFAIIEKKMQKIFESMRMPS
jgi:hypothetical protein